RRWVRTRLTRKKILEYHNILRHENLIRQQNRTWYMSNTRKTFTSDDWNNFKDSLTPMNRRLVDDIDLALTTDRYTNQATEIRANLLHEMGRKPLPQASLHPQTGGGRGRGGRGGPPPPPTPQGRGGGRGGPPQS